MRRGLLPIVIALMLVLGPSAGHAEREPECPPGDEVCAAVELLYSEGILEGYPDGSFGGERLVDRSMLAFVIARLFGMGHGNGHAPPPSRGEFRQVLQEIIREADPMTGAELEVRWAEWVRVPVRAGLPDGQEMVRFSDVTTDHYAYDVVDRANVEGHMQGFPDGTFRLDQPVTRYEFAVTLANVRDEFVVDRDVLNRALAGQLEAGRGVSPSDVPEDHWAWGAVMDTLEAGSMDVDAHGHFNGNGIVTRNDMAVMLARLFEDADSREYYNPREALASLEKLRRLGAGRVVVESRAAARRSQSEAEPTIG